MPGSPNRLVRGPAQRPTKTRPDTTAGHVLERERVRRGLSRQEVADQLHMPQKQIQGLETGDMSVFPAEVYARGAFIRYTEFLGIQSERLQRAFQRALTGSREYVPLSVHTPRSWLAATITAHWVLALTVAGVAGIVGIYIGWQVMGYVRLPQLELSAPLSSVTSAALIEVQGSAASDATVAINETQVLLDKSGNFSLTIPVNEGINVVQVSATNAAGRTNVIEKHVFVPAAKNP